MKWQLLIMIMVFPIVAFGQEPEQYNAHKLVKEKAKNSCLVLASISLQPEAYRALAVNTEPKIQGVIHPRLDGYNIVVRYPYRNDGVNFACVFRDYRNKGLIQLIEFGNVGGGVEDVTKAKLLW